MVARTDRVSATRERILTTAERLFAQQGVSSVSNRQISEAAGQGNNAAVGYHFGAKTDLVRAIIRRHAEPIEDSRARLVARAGDSTTVLDWVDCLIRPMTEHLAALGVPSWYARFNAQVMTNPALREVMAEESLGSHSLMRTIEGLRRCLPGLPPEVRNERGDMARHLLVHMVAERERALAEDLPTPRASWHEATVGLTDAITGMWLAPLTPRS